MTSKSFRQPFRAGKPSFVTTGSDYDSIKAIVDRFVTLLPEADRMSTTMDLLATHANGNPMDFQRLLAADDFNLMHDVVGIGRHLDRETGKLMNCFRPRFSRREQVAAA